MIRLLGVRGTFGRMCEHSGACMEGRTPMRDRNAVSVSWRAGWGRHRRQGVLPSTRATHLSLAGHELGGHRPTGGISSVNISSHISLQGEKHNPRNHMIRKSAFLLVSLMWMGCAQAALVIECQSRYDHPEVRQYIGLTGRRQLF